MSNPKNVSSDRKKIPPSERVSFSLKELASKTPALKLAAAELCTNIARSNNILRKLDLDVSAWFKFAGSQEDENGYYSSREIGYTKLGPAWGIALKKAAGNHHENYYEEQVWSFHEAPLWMQIESVTKIPDLLDALNERVDETIKQLGAKALQAAEFVDALKAALAEIGQDAE